MRLSFYTYSYTDRLDMPIEPCLKRIAKTGYSGIDVSGTNGPSADPNSFDRERRELTHRLAEKLELRVEAVITHAQLTDTLVDPNRKVLDLKGTVDLAQHLDCPVVTFHMGGYHAGVARDRLWRQVVDAIKDAADYGMARHVSLAVDGIWPVWIDNSPAELARLFKDVDRENFGVNFDPCYLALMGVDPVDFAKQFHRRILHCHIKDHRGKYPKWKHLLPGAGDMDYKRVFAALKRVKFAHSAAVECFTDMKFEQACDECFVDMKKAAGEADVDFDK
ncbi:MAG: sugar phosphate isomerase/epimerase [Pirellulaceae bacterium]|jgi:sugar phosphate isomerase/epimerase|nr:sugar phosphate isomerase/epimerase [Pirellulaceae bacterium]